MVALRPDKKAAASQLRGGRVVDIEALRAFIHSHPLIRNIAAPALAMRRMYRIRNTLRMRRISERTITKLRQVLAADVLLAVKEFDGVFEINPESDLFLRVVLDQAYEPDLAEVVLRSIDATKDAIDIGANIGFFSVAMAKRLAPRRVLAIEPSALAASRLKKNVSINGVERSVIIFNGAAAEKPGQLTLHTVLGKEEYSSLGGIVHPSVATDKTSTETVMVNTVDDLVTQYQLTPGFIKMDAEGAEYRVLMGASRTLARHKPTIVSELSDPLLRSNGSSSVEVVGLLHEAGYTVEDLEDPASLAGTKAWANIICTPKANPR